LSVHVPSDQKTICPAADSSVGPQRRRSWMRSPLPGAGVDVGAIDGDPPRTASGALQRGPLAPNLPGPLKPVNRAPSHGPWRRGPNGRIVGGTSARTAATIRAGTPAVLGRERPEGRLAMGSVLAKGHAGRRLRLGRPVATDDEEVVGVVHRAPPARHARHARRCPRSCVFVPSSKARVGRGAQECSEGRLIRRALIRGNTVEAGGVGPVRDLASGCYAGARVCRRSYWGRLGCLCRAQATRR
jgi:hypothetical protein